MPDPDFYITGGTIPPDAPSYVARRADEDLFSALRRGDTCYVLNARQMGKSSLCVRTRAALEREGIRTAFLDLQKFGSSATAEQWYRSLLERLGHDLKLRTEFLTYWRENQERTPIDRLMGALREIALVRIPGPLVVFLDEIDVVRDLGFKTDEFFAAIRQCYNARVEDPDFQRLRFCIIGTVAPTDLIRDVRLSPFNIGTRIVLADFTAKEAAPLAAPLVGKGAELERVLWWTSGHPYLTQRLCAELSRSGSRDVDGTAARLFLAKSEADVDENIKNVRNALLRMGGEAAGFDRVDLLTRYGRILAGKAVTDDDTDAVCAALRLSGLVRAEGGRLRVRNRIYARVFDREWVEKNLPDAEVRRQRAAYRQGLLRALAVCSAVGLVLVGLAAYAFHQANRADWFARDALTQKADAITQQRLAMLQSRKAQQNAADASLQRRLADNRAREAEKERHTATDALGEANRQRHAATVAAADAVRQRQTAISALADAKKEKKLADARLIQANQNLRAANLARGAEASAKQDALKKAVLAREAAERAEHAVYLADMNLVQSEWGARNLTHVLQLLDETRSSPSRGFEWGYWNRQCHLDLLTFRDHTNTINSLAFSGDSKHVLTGSEDGTAKVWDLASGRLLLTIPTLPARVNAAAFSPDERRIVTVSGPIRYLRHGTIAENVHCSVWDAASGKEISSRDLHGSVHWAIEPALSPDGTRVAAMDTDAQFKGKVSVWDPNSGARLLTLDHRTDGFVYAAFSSDGKRLVTKAEFEPPILWDARTGERLLTLAPGRERVMSLAFSHDGKLVITGNETGTFTFWSTATGQIIRHMPGHSADVECASFSPDGSRILTGSDDNTAKVWDTKSGSLLFTLRGHSGPVTVAAYTPDGERILTGGQDHTVKVWDPATGEGAILNPDPAAVVSFTEDGNQVVTVGESGSRILEASNGRELAHRPLIAPLYPEPGQSPLLAVTRDPWTPHLSPDGTRMIAGRDDNTLLIGDAITGKITSRVRVGKDTLKCVAWSPVGNCVFAGDWSGSGGLYDPSSGKLLRRLTEKGIAYWASAFSADGKQLITGDNAGGVKVWDAETGLMLLSLPIQSAEVSAVAFSKDGKLLATGCGNGSLKIWIASTGMEVVSLVGHTDNINSICFSSDGRRLLTASNDNTTRVWDVATGRGTLLLMSKPKESELDKVRSASFSPDGSRIVTGGLDGVHIWMTDFHDRAPSHSAAR